MRALPAILAVAVVLATAHIGQAQTAPDRKPPVIKHTPVTVVTEGMDIIIVADIRDASGIFAPMVWYRSLGAETYSSIDLILQANKTYSAMIPGRESIEYWLEAYDELGNGPARFGTPEKPYKVTLKPAPAPANTLMATGPKGESAQGSKAAPGAPPLTFVAVTPDPALNNTAPAAPTSLLKSAKELEVKPTAPLPVSEKSLPPAPTTESIAPVAATPAPVIESKPVAEKTVAPATESSPVVEKTVTPAPTTVPEATTTLPAVAETPTAATPVPESTVADPVPAPAVVQEAPKPAEVDLTPPVVKKKKKTKDASKSAALNAKPASGDDLSVTPNTTPIYKRWWFIGGTSVVAAAGIGLLVYALLPNTVDQNVFTPTMRRP